MWLPDPLRALVDIRQRQLFKWNNKYDTDSGCSCRPHSNSKLQSLHAIDFPIPLWDQNRAVQDKFWVPVHGADIRRGRNWLSSFDCWNDKFDLEIIDFLRRYSLAEGRTIWSLRRLQDFGLCWRSDGPFHNSRRNHSHRKQRPPGDYIFSRLS